MIRAPGLARGRQHPREGRRLGVVDRLRDRVRRHSVPASRPAATWSSKKRKAAGAAGRTRPGPSRSTPRRAAPHPRRSTPGCGAGTRPGSRGCRRPSDRSSWSSRNSGWTQCQQLCWYRTISGNGRPAPSRSRARARFCPGRSRSSRRRRSPRARCVPSGRGRRRPAPPAPRCRRRRSSSRCRRGSRRPERALERGAVDGGLGVDPVAAEAEPAHREPRPAERPVRETVGGARGARRGSGSRRESRPPPGRLLSSLSPPTRLLRALVDCGRPPVRARPSYPAAAAGPSYTRPGLRAAPAR